MVEELQKERNDLIKEMGILQAKLRHAVGSIQEQVNKLFRNETFYIF